MRRLLIGALAVVFGLTLTTTAVSPAAKAAPAKDATVAVAPSVKCQPSPYFPPVPPLRTKPVGGGSDTKPSSRVPRGFYGEPIRYKSGPLKGHINIGAVTAALKKRGASFYQILIANHWGYNSAWDFADAGALLDSFQRNTITAGIILLPPTEASNTCYCASDGYAPYNGNYDAWYAAVGDLAKTHPALKYTGMDDFAYSLNYFSSGCRTFSVGSPAHWQTILKKHAGRDIPFVPTMYYGELMSGAWTAFHGSVNTVVWPFEGIGHAQWISGQYSKLHKRLGSKTKIIVMIYAKYYKGLKPTEKTVAAEVAAALKVSPTAVVVYYYQLG